MYAFLVLLFPAALFRHIVRLGDIVKVHCAWQAAFLSIVLCTAKAFLTFSYRISSASIFIEIAHSFFLLTIVPLLSVTAILFIAWKTRKPWPSCISAFFAAHAAFMAIYLPFITLAGSHSAYSAYELFYRPPLYLMMSVSLARCIKLIASAHINPFLHLRRLGYPMLFLFLIAPSIIDTMWFMNRGAWSTAWGIYIALSAVWYVICSPAFRPRHNSN